MTRHVPSTSPAKIKLELQIALLLFPSLISARTSLSSIPPVHSQFTPFPVTAAKLVSEIKLCKASAGGRRGTAEGDSVGRMLNTDRHDGEPSANILTSRFRETGPSQIESTYTQLPAFTPSSTSRHPCCWSGTTVSRSQTVKLSNTTRTRTEVMETLPGSFIRS